MASRPEELCRLIGDALGDGDLDAALTYYEPDAMTCLPGAPAARGTAQIARALSRAVSAKLAFDVQVERVVGTDTVALLAGTWTARGIAATGVAVQRAGTVRSVARRRADGAWRVLIEDLAATQPAALADRP